MQLSDISFDGVNGEVMDMAWSEITFATSSQHEEILDAVHKIFHKKCRDPDERWSPHLSLAYDNPEDSPLCLEHAVSLVSRYPTLVKERKAKAISLWSTYGRMDEWRCLDRIYLDSE